MSVTLRSERVLSFGFVICRCFASRNIGQAYLYPYIKLSDRYFCHIENSGSRGVIGLIIKGFGSINLHFGIRFGIEY